MRIHAEIELGATPEPVRAGRAERTLAALPGVHVARVSTGGRCILVQLDPERISLETLRAELERLGMTVGPARLGSRAGPAPDPCC